MPVEDVVIIGAGIAGITAAKFISSYGISPLVLESGKTLSTKACGDGVHDKSVEGMDFFDLYESKKGVLRHVSKGDVSFEDVEITFKYPIYTIDKMAVQREIARQARRNGSKFMFNSKVTEIKRSGKHLVILPQKIKAKLVIGCDGYYSICRQFLKQPIKQSAFGVRGYLKKKSSRVKIWYAADDGYAWSFPKKGECNVGVGSMMSTHDVGDLLVLLKEFFGKVSKVKGAPIPTEVPPKTYANNMMIVGDAASQVLSASGGGILTSMICAKLCADVTDEAVKRGRYDSRFLKNYEDAWNEVLGRSFRKSYEYLRRAFDMLEHKSLARISFRLMSGVIQKKLEEDFVV